jgi:hypothetical protein
VGPFQNQREHSTRPEEAQGTVEKIGKATQRNPEEDSDHETAGAKLGVVLPDSAGQDEADGVALQDVDEND